MDAWEVINVEIILGQIRVQAAAENNPLLQLAEIRRIQLAIEFRLACQNHLNQFAAPVLEIP